MVNDEKNVTPMLRQYLEIKKAYPGTLLFFRLGDFYELFGDDAIIGSRELQITLTARQKGSENPIPMCGVPHHASSSYISKLVRKGYRVAICEQAEPAAKGVKLVKREVVRVITPGTSIDEQLESSYESVYLASICFAGETVGAAFLELSTGDFSATEYNGPDAWIKIRETIDQFSPMEIVVDHASKRVVCENLGFAVPKGLFDFGQDLSVSDQPPANFGSGVPLFTELDLGELEHGRIERILTDHFQVRGLSGFGLDNRPQATLAAVVCLEYARKTQKSAISHITEISFFRSTDHLVLDSTTISNLDLIRSRSQEKRRTLLGVIDDTVTAMGSRLLQTWLLRPSIKRSEIETRLVAVGELSDPQLRDKIRFLLKRVADLERLTGKLNLGTLVPRDLNALKGSLDQTPLINEVLTDARSLLLQVLSENVFELPEIRELIESAISEAPANSPSDGGVIRDGFDSELDELREVANSTKATIAAFEKKERDRTGIATLKVRYNSVFGYYIEVSKANLSRVPENFERRQTLANAERFTTPELKEWEQRVRGAEDRTIQIETELFRKVVANIQEGTRKMLTTARALATLDVLASFAETASKRNYCAPALHDGDEIEIKNGRHPIVEAFMDGEFVPNDTYLNNSTDRLLIVTGANMGGKSTVLRQIAIIQILAQIGSFVPASFARLPIVDRVWTRVGASDDLASGRSTFMVEMTETAAILHNATPRSLVLLDEIGRGTSTFDGLSIAWAVAEYLHDSPEHSAKTVFATHYHELTELAESLPGAKNYQITATETDGNVVFLHKLRPGSASKSYGIAVAKLAGLPEKVIGRAKEVLSKLEEYELAVFSNEPQAKLGIAAGKGLGAQASLFSVAGDPEIDPPADAGTVGDRPGD